MAFRGCAKLTTIICNAVKITGAYDASTMPFDAAGGSLSYKQSNKTWADHIHALASKWVLKSI
jgi:hypothetical protein